MRKIEYRQLLEPNGQQYMIVNNLIGDYGHSGSSSIRLVSCKGVELEDFYWPKGDTTKQQDLLTKMLNGQQSEWILGAVQLRCDSLAFYFHHPKNDVPVVVFLEELEDVAFWLEVERDESLPPDRYFIDSTEDVYDDIHEQGMSDNGRSMFRPRVTEWDGHKKREIVIRREVAKLSYEDGEYDYWANIVEYC